MGSCSECGQSRGHLNGCPTQGSTSPVAGNSKRCQSTKPSRTSSITGQPLDDHNHWCCGKTNHKGSHFCGEWKCTETWK